MQDPEGQNWNYSMMKSVFFDVPRVQIEPLRSRYGRPLKRPNKTWTLVICRINQGRTSNWKSDFLMDCVFFNNILIQILRFAYFPVTNSKGKNSFHGRFKCFESLTVVWLLILFCTENRAKPKFAQAPIALRQLNAQIFISNIRIHARVSYSLPLIFRWTPKKNWIKSCRFWWKCCDRVNMHSSIELSWDFRHRTIFSRILVNRSIDSLSLLRYQKCFDLEGESGIVVRGIGTCVFLKKMFSSSSPATPTKFSVSPRDSTCTQEQ